MPASGVALSEAAVSATGAGGPNHGHPASVASVAFGRHRRRQHNRRTLLVGTGPSVSERRRHRVSATAAGCDVGQAADDWGRSADPPRPRGSGAAVAGSGAASPAGTVAGYASEPTWIKGLALLGARGIAECGLRWLGGVAVAVCRYGSAAARQARDAAGRHSGSRLCLATRPRISIC